MASKLSSYCSLDFETTGTALFHGCLPFALSIGYRDFGSLKANPRDYDFPSSALGRIKTKFWEWPVDPQTRIPIIPRKDLAEVISFLDRFDVWTIHNSRFDIRCAALIGLLNDYGLPYGSLPATDEVWEKVHCTLVMSHVLDSLEEHGLKQLAFKYGDIPLDDQKKLGKEVQHARKIAKKLGYKIAEYPHVLGLGKSDSAWHWDYWILKALDKKSKTLETYNRQDAVRGLVCYEIFREALLAETSINIHGIEQPLWNIYDEERKLIPVFYEMESAGMPIDLRRSAKIRKRIGDVATKADLKIIDIAVNHGFGKEFNPRSNAVQLPQLLFSKVRDKRKKLLQPISLNKPNKHFPFGVPCCDKDDLAEIWTQKLGNYANEEGGERQFDKDKSEAAVLIDAILTSRTFGKGLESLQSYERLSLPEKMPATVSFSRFGTKIIQNVINVLHGSLNQNATCTTRISASNPNQTNVSTKSELGIREIFVPAPDEFWFDPDYANLELRIKAYLAGEKSLIKEFEAGRSAMMKIAEELWKIPREQMDNKDKPYYWKYKRTKNFVYSKNYGSGAVRGDATLGIAGASALWANRFPRMQAYDDLVIREAKLKGYVYTAGGYRLYVNKDRAYTTAVSYTIQGTAGQIIKRAMNNLRYNPLPQHITQKFVQHALASYEGKFKPEFERPKLRLQIHDELILSAPRSWITNSVHPEKTSELIACGRWIKQQMEEPGLRVGLPTPVDVAIVTDSWANPEKLKI